jgi:recombination protein RecA
MKNLDKSKIVIGAGKKSGSGKTFSGDLTDVNALASKDIAKSLFNKIMNSGLVNKDFVHYNEEDPPPKEFIKTGIAKLDIALGGGIPIGKVGEIFGQNATGKSTLTYHLAKAFQHAGGYALSVDTEHSWDQERAESIGVDRARIILSEVDTVEQLFGLINSTISAQVQLGDDATPCIIIIDTVAAAPTAPEMAAISAGKGYEDMGRKAKYLSAQMRQLPRSLGASRIALVFVNQVRMKMNTMAFQDPFDSTGGQAIRFYSSWRLKLSNLGKIKEGEEVVGQKVRIETIKCKTASPFQKIELDLVYRTGTYDQLASVLAELKLQKILKKSKSGYKLGQELVALGFEESYSAEREDEFRNMLESKLDSVMAMLGGVTLETADETASADDAEVTTTE